MFRRLWLPLLLCLSAAVAYGAERGEITGVQSFETPSWFKVSFLDIADDAAEAAEDGRHLMVFFHLKNCPYCAKMLADSFSEKESSAFIRANFDVVEVNVQGDREVAYRDEDIDEDRFAKAVGVAYTPALLFFDAAGVAVLTVNGYRAPMALKTALSYVRDGAYRRMPLAEYGKQKAPVVYKLRAHPDFNAGADLSAVDKPLMVVVEDDTCADCEWVHDNVLNKADVREQLQNLAVARINAKSSDTVTAPSGEKTTQEEFADSLGLHYRPGVVFFDGGREVFRITGLLNHYHFREAARYVAGGHNKKYKRWGAYLRERREELLASGENVDYSIPS